MVWLKESLLDKTLRLESNILFSFPLRPRGMFIPNFNNRTIWEVGKLVTREWVQTVFMSIVCSFKTTVLSIRLVWWTNRQDQVASWHHRNKDIHTHYTKWTTRFRMHLALSWRHALFQNFGLFNVCFSTKYTRMYMK